MLLLTAMPWFDAAAIAADDDDASDEEMDFEENPPIPPGMGLPQQFAGGHGFGGMGRGRGRGAGRGGYLEQMQMFAGQLLKTNKDVDFSSAFVPNLRMKRDWVQRHFVNTL